MEKGKKKKNVIIISGILVIVLLAVGGICIFKSLKKSNALKLVQPADVVKPLELLGMI